MRADSPASLLCCNGASAPVSHCTSCAFDILIATDHHPLLRLALVALHVECVLPTRYMESQLAISFRTRLTIYAYDKYFEQQTFYKVREEDHKNEKHLSIFQ